MNAAIAAFALYAGAGLGGCALVAAGALYRESRRLSRRVDSWRDVTLARQAETARQESEDASINLWRQGGRRSETRHETEALREQERSIRARTAYINRRLDEQLDIARVYGTKL